MTVPLRTRILVADDHTVVRRGLRMVLDAARDLEVVAEAQDGIEAVELGLREDIHLAVLDVAMPRRTGLQAARELVRRRPELRVLMLSMHDLEDYCFEALKAGARATCSRPSPTATSSRPAARPCAASRSCTRRRSAR